MNSGTILWNGIERKSTENLQIGNFKFLKLDSITLPGGSLQNHLALYVK